MFVFEISVNNSGLRFPFVSTHKYVNRGQLHPKPKRLLMQWTNIEIEDKKS